MTIPQNILFPFGKHPSVRLLHQRFGPSGQLPGFRGSDPLGRNRIEHPHAERVRHPHAPAFHQAPRAVDHDRLYADARTLRHQKSPVLEAADLAGPRPRPFREHDDRSTSRQALDAAFHHPLGAAARSAFDRDIAVHPQHPAEDRHLLHLFFRHPLEVERQHVHQRNVEHRLMIRHDDPRTAPIDLLPAFDPQLP